MYYPIVKIPLNIQFAITEKIYLPTLPNEPIKPQMPQEEADTFSHLWGRGCLFYFAYIVIYWVVRFILSMLNVEIPTEIQSILTLISSLWCVIWAFLGLLVPNKEKQQLRFQKKLDEYRKKQEKYHQEEREYNSVRNILNNKEKYIKEQRLIKTRNGFYSERINESYINNTQGRSENYFYEYLYSRFGDKILRNRSVGVFLYSNGFIPDFIYFDEKSTIKIDIEIDEPYDLTQKEPIHYLMDKDKTSDWSRDKYFIDSGWIVMRFAEEQVVKHPDRCCDLINYVVNSIICDTPFILDTVFYPQIKMWTFEEAKVLASKNYRDSYSI